jgi:hypothetical protein
MPLDQDPVTNLRWVTYGPNLIVSWDSSEPAGTVYQLYADRKLVWSGVGKRAVIGVPRSRVTLRAGVVDPSEFRTDFSPSLPAPYSPRVLLEWYGGRSQDPDIDGFHVYSGLVPGGAVSYARPVGSVTAFPAGIYNDGWGAGAWGRGNWGNFDLPFSWTSGRLAAGAWNFAVKSVDRWGNEGAAVTFSATVTAPPEPPAPNAFGKRLTVAYDDTANTADLDWIP